jgi:hypothetical protein
VLVCLSECLWLVCATPVEQIGELNMHRATISSNDLLSEGITARAFNFPLYFVSQVVIRQNRAATRALRREIIFFVAVVELLGDDASSAFQKEKVTCVHKFLHPPVSLQTRDVIFAN